ncbi:hypothetical protein OROMI_002213 [Orobanche minor]
MPPKRAATTTKRSGRTISKVAPKSSPKSNPTTLISSPPSSSTTAVAPAVVPPPPTSAQESRSILHPCTIKKTQRKPHHAAPPASQTQPRNSQETLASDKDNVESDVAKIDGRTEDSGKSLDLQEPGFETATVLGSRDGSENTANLSSVPAVRSPLQDDGSVEPVTGPESGMNGVTGPGNGKRRVVKKVVRIVKKVIKKRVPKRVLKAEEIEVTKNLNIDNDGIEKSDYVIDVIEKPNVVNDAKDILNIADDISENSNLVNDDACENPNLVDGVTEKTSIVNEVSVEQKITDDFTQNIGLVNSAGVLEPINGEKGKTASVIDSTETETSEPNFGASTSAQSVPANDQSGINTSETDNIMSNDVITSVPDPMKVEKVNYIPQTIIDNMDTEEVADTLTEDRAKDSVLENQEADRTLDLVGGQGNVLVGDTDGITFGKPESAGGSGGLILSGEMEALERKKRRRIEIFVGGLDGDVKEDDIRKVFEEFGIVVEVRLVMSGNTGRNRGYAFVRFSTADDAKNAVAKYSKVEICGKQCNVAPVEGNDTIFLGNIDRNWKTEDVVTLLEKAGIKKIDKVTLKADPNNFEKNRGFAFLEFQTSKDAQIAFNKLQKRDAFGKKLTVKVAWAQPLIEPDEEEILKVKSVYAEYLPSSWDEEKVKEYFKRFGEIENVVLAQDLPSSRRKDFAFINYTNREAALTCIESISRERSEDQGSKVKIAVSLANSNAKGKLMKITPDGTSKQPPKAKPKAINTSIKLHEPRYERKPVSSSYNYVNVDNKSSTTSELVQILRQQASNKHVHHHLHPHLRPATAICVVVSRTRISSPDHRFFPFPGSKRPFSQVGYDPLYLEPQGLSRARVESSYPISGPSYSSRGVDGLSFPYHPQPRPAFTSNQSSGGEATLIIFRRESKKLLIIERETIIYTADIEYAQNRLSQFGAKWN